MKFRKPSGEILLLGLLAICLRPDSVDAKSPELLSHAKKLEDNHRIVRDYVDGPFGQVHIRTAQPTSKASKPPLILFHPTPYSSGYFTAFMKEMAMDRIVIAIDTPGYGDSATLDRLPTIADYARSASMVLKKLGYDDNPDKRVDLLGYHTGTLIAIELAVQNPALVRRLVLPGLPFFTGDNRRRAYLNNAKPLEITRDGSHLKKEWEFSATAVDNGLSLTRAQQHFGDAMQCQPDCWKAYHAVFTYKSEQQIPKVKQSTLLITTAGSLKAEAEAALPLFPTAKIVHVADITYGGFDLHADKLAQVTREFLNNSEEE